jgi:hypothetical protein
MVRALLLATLVLFAFGCKGGATAQAKKVDLDADPLALLPPGALVVAWVDAQALYGSARLGPKLTSLSDRIMPLGEDAGFVPSRDVLRIATAAYATGDGVAVLRGRFDRARIESAQSTKTGARVTHGTYAGHATSTTDKVSFAVLTAHTAVAATGDGLRRVLDRVAALEAGGVLAPALSSWMVESLTDRSVAPPPAVAVAADVVNQPIAAATIATLKVPWLEGIQRAKVLAAMREQPVDPGLHVSATFTYADAAHAEEAANGARLADKWLKVLGPFIGGVELSDFEVASQDSDARCSFAVDDRSVVALLSLATRLLPN